MLELNELLLLEAYVQNAFAGFVLMDEHNCIVVSTPQANEIMGVELKGRNLNDFIRDKKSFPQGNKVDLANSTKPRDTYVDGFCIKKQRKKLYTCARFPFEFEGHWYQGGFFAEV